MNTWSLKIKPSYVTDNRAKNPDFIVIPAIKEVRARTLKSTGEMLGLFEAKNFCQGNGTLTVNKPEDVLFYTQLFGGKYIDCVGSNGIGIQANVIQHLDNLGKWDQKFTIKIAPQFNKDYNRELICACKAVRIYSGMGLKESKDFCVGDLELVDQKLEDAVRYTQFFGIAYTITTPPLETLVNTGNFSLVPCIPSLSSYPSPYISAVPAPSAPVEVCRILSTPIIPTASIAPKPIAPIATVKKVTAKLEKDVRKLLEKAHKWKNTLSMKNKQYLQLLMDEHDEQKHS